MAVRLNEDKEVVERIRRGLKEKDGYCPCRIPKLPEFKCICDEFKAQIADRILKDIVTVCSTTSQRIKLRKRKIERY